MGRWNGRGHYIHVETICTPWVWYVIGNKIKDMYLRYKAHWGTLLWDLTKINVRWEPLPRLLSLPLVLPQQISKIKLKKIHVTQVRCDFFSGIDRHVYKAEAHYKLHCPVNLFYQLSQYLSNDTKGGKIVTEYWINAKTCFRFWCFSCKTTVSTLWNIFTKWDMPTDYSYRGGQVRTGDTSIVAS